MAGNITIIEAHDNFQKVSREIIRNREVDLLTLAIYVKVLYFGKQWKLDINGLSKALGITHQRVRRAINLLEREGYVRRIAVRDEQSGRMMGWDYFVYAEPLSIEERTPISHRLVKKPKYGSTDNTVQPQYGETDMTVKWQGNNIDSTENIDSTLKLDDVVGNEVSTTTTTTNETPKRTRQFTKPTVAEIRAYAESIQYDLNAEYFFDYYERAGWTYGNGKSAKPIKDWRACVRLWKRRDDASKPKETGNPATKEYAPKHNYYSTEQ